MEVSVPVQKREDTKEGMFSQRDCTISSLIVDQFQKVQTMKINIHHPIRELKVIAINQIDIQLGGRLQFFQENWKKLTSDKKKILESINSYTIEFTEKPIQARYMTPRFSNQEQKCIDQEISEMIKKKGAIEEVKSQNEPNPSS